MRRPWFILLFTFINCSTIHAKQSDPISEVQENCFEGRDWEQTQCQVISKVSADYQARTTTMAAFFLATGAEYYLSEFAGEVLNMTSIVAYDAPRSGSTKRRIIVESIRQLFREKNLSSCQKACVVKCATSSILKYEFNLGSKLGSIYRAYEEGGGTCTEFAKVALDLGRSTGVPVRLGPGTGHASNRFKIDGEWYFAEPQNSKCEFFKNYGISQEEVETRTKSMNQRETVVEQDSYSRIDQFPTESEYQ